jgi:hypothetical protein
MGFFFFLFFSILWCNHTDNHPQEELAKFGYNSERKVEIFKNCTTFWQLIGTYCPWPEDTILEFLEPNTPTVVVRLSVHPVRKLWEMNSYNDARHTPICFRWSYCQNCKQTCTRHPTITRNKFLVCFSLGRPVAAAVHHVQHVWIIIASHEIPICEWEFYFILKILLLKKSS